jgi:hypothetical protein
MKSLLRILQSAFGCHHGQMSRVFTIKKRTYRICFQCGQEFDYSWASMQPLRSSSSANGYAQLNEVGRAGVPAIEPVGAQASRS